MKKLLIIYPHWPPSNLAGVHRSRLISNFSQEFGWDVTVLTVHESHYEESVDPDLCRLVAPHIEIITTSAFPVIKLFGKRLIGDIGIRSWLQLKRRLIELLKSEKYDFIWIPIPSWYTALLGRVGWKKYKTPYGIDYIDPWVYQLTRYEKRFSRAWWTRQMALVLEPIAIRYAALISGVSAEYYAGTISRNFSNKMPPVTIEMPYGFDPRDHTIELENPTLPFDPDEKNYIFYAGAFLPHSERFMRSLFEVVHLLHSMNKWPKNLVFRFIGIGKRPGKSITDLAMEAGIAHLVHEYPDRYPFLVVQHLLRRAKFNLIVGSTEPHYTASKTFQCLLAMKPIFAVFHEESSAIQFLKETNADRFTIGWTESKDVRLNENLAIKMLQMLENQVWSPNLKVLDKHSARESGKVLFEGIESVLGKPSV